MNIGPDADPMTAFRELFGSFGGGQGGGGAPGAGVRQPITSQSLAPPQGGVDARGGVGMATPASPANDGDADDGYNPLADPRQMTDGAINELRWNQQHQNAPMQAPMGKRAPASTGIQQSAGTSQPTQGQAPVPGNKAPVTPPPGATAAQVMSKPLEKPEMNLTGEAPMPDGGGGQIPPVASASKFGGGGYNTGPAIPVDPGQPGLRGGQAPNAHGFQNGVRDIIARLMQGGQNVAEFMQPGFTAGKPMMPPGGSTQPPMPQEMMMQALMDRQRNGVTQGNTPIR